MINQCWNTKSVGSQLENLKILTNNPPASAALTYSRKHVTTSKSQVCFHKRTTTFWFTKNGRKTKFGLCRNQDNMSLIETYYLHAREPTQGRLSSTRQVSRLRQSRNTIGNFACGVPQDIPETAILPKEWLTAPLKIPGKQPFFGF